MFHKFLTFLNTALPHLAIPVAGGMTYWRYHKHLFGISEQEDKLSYSQEKEPLDENTQRIIVELTEYITLRWNPMHVASIRWFVSNTKDPVVRGSTSTRSGTVIGIPYSFSYKNAADIDTSKLISDYRIVNNLDEINREKFLSLLVLSDNAKKFALARELKFINSKYVHIDGLVPLACFGFGVISAAVMNRSQYFNITRTKPTFRFLVYTVIACFALQLNQQTLKSYFKDLHLSSDRDAAKMGKEYVMGGIEYTSKLLNRNKLIRELNGKTGEETYTPIGDEIPGYFSTDAPISLRLKYMIGQAKTLYEKDESVNELIEKIVKEIDDVKQ